MCGRFGFFELEYFIEQLRQLDILFEEQAALDYRRHWNIAPDSEIVALLAENGQRSLRSVRWGLIPHWSGPDPKIRPINARSDTVAVKPFYRSMMERRHCLIPASGFYEWKSVGSKRKEAWYARRRDDTPMAFAGLWDTWTSRDAHEEKITSCTIITTDANPDLRPIHDRMPVVLEPEKWQLWLDAENPGSAELLKPAATGTLMVYQVPERVNNPRNDDASCVLPVSGEKGNA